MEAKQVLEIALSAGQILISNGAESYRVEETIERICNSYNLECECMSTPKGVFVSVIDEDNEKITSLKKVSKKRVDLYRIELINSFSRDLQNKAITYEEALSTIDKIQQAPYFTFRVRLLAACMTSFIYAVFFGGTIYDAFIAAIISMGIYCMLEKVSHVGFFQFFEFFFSGFIIGTVSIIAHKFFPLVNTEHVITGAIMILIPGVALTNGLKDILYDDFMSGITKFGEAMLIITAIGAGIGTALTLRIGAGL